MRDTGVLQAFINQVLDKFSNNKPVQQIFYSIIPAIEKEFLQSNSKLRISEMLKVLGLGFFGKNTFSVTENEEILKHGIHIFPAQLNHLDSSIPVYEKLKKDGHLVYFWVQREDIGQKLTEKGIVFNQINLHFQTGVSKDSIFTTFFVFRILAVCFTSSIKIRMPKVFINTIKALQNFTFVMSVSKASDYIISRFKPSYVLLGYDNSVLCRPFNYKCASENIVTGCIQHGVINYLLMPTSLVSQYFVWDETDAKAIFTRNKKITTVVSGPVINQTENIDNNNFYKEVLEFILRFRQQNKKIAMVVFSGPGHNVSLNGHKVNINSLLIAAKNFPDLAILIKLHPKDNLAFYGDLQEMPNVLISKPFESHVNDIDFYLEQTDMVVTGASTVSFEAWRKNIPVIFMDLIEELKHIPFKELNMGYEVYCQKELNDAINSCFSKDAKFKEIAFKIEEYRNRFSVLQKQIPINIIAKNITN